MKLLVTRVQVALPPHAAQASGRDPFARNLYRGDTRAWAVDVKA